jgi:gluconokinase
VCTARVVLILAAPPSGPLSGQPNLPVLLVMGVSGTGKTTIGHLLADRLGWPYADADDFHPAANVAKMAAGQPLTDHDRWPWLETIGRWIDIQRAAGQPGVASCSALKRAYRELLRRGRPEVKAIFLDGSRELIGRRLLTRHGHFMKAHMLDSQFADLERPTPDEPTLVVSIDATPAEIVDTILGGLALQQRPT